MKKRFLLAGLAAIGLAAAALAQAIPVPYVASLGQTDAVQVLPNGVPSAQGRYAAPGWIGGVEQYSYQVPLTGFTITVPAHVDLLYLNPAGTLATGTVTMEATPSDGQRVCFEDTQIQTAVTINAGTGSSMLTSIGLGAVTAFTANTKYCWYYNKPLGGWIRTS